ncbi:MAG: 2'-5' RNA ligase family protein [Pelolinea sp.]|nr:2'-5' RNA ligase family protein [Pelolinea sp.]
MAYAIVLYFDENSEYPIYDVLDKLGEKGLSPSIHKGSIRPHMTLAIYDSINCSECEDEIKRFCEKPEILNIQADHFGIFPHETSVIFIAPAPTNELMNFQKKIHQILEGNVGEAWEMYQPGKWVPHCTLARDINKKDLSAALEICIQMKLPLDLRITQIGVVEFEPITPLFEVNLTED